MALINEEKAFVEAWDLRTWRLLYRSKEMKEKSLAPFQSSWLAVDGAAFEAVGASCRSSHGERGTLLQRIGLADGRALGTVVVAQDKPLSSIEHMSVCQGSVFLRGVDHKDVKSGQSSSSWRMFDLLNAHRSDGRRRKFPRAASDPARKRRKVVEIDPIGTVQPTL